MNSRALGDCSQFHRAFGGYGKYLGQFDIFVYMVHNLIHPHLQCAPSPRGDTSRPYRFHPLPVIVMANCDELIICEHCDCVFEKVDLSKHQTAYCARCGGVIQRFNGLTIDQRLALTITAAVLWILANFYPVMTISLQGVRNSATLWDSVLALSLGPITFIAMVAAISIIIAPAFQLILLAWVLSFAVSQQRAPGFRLSMRWLDSLRPWSMLEVCLLGALVAVFKLAGMLDVVPGVGLFALAVLSLMMIRIAGRDVRELWDIP